MDSSGAANPAIKNISSKPKLKLPKVTYTSSLILARLDQPATFLS